MPSKALIDWQTGACAAFDEIEHAHRAVGGTKPGRRFVTQQLNYAYATLLAARFQGFARALHSQTTARRWVFPGLGDTFKTMAHTKTSPAKLLKVGDRVVSNLPAIQWKGVVVEDRGLIASNGSQIVAIRLDNHEEDSRFEVRAEDLERVAA